MRARVLACLIASLAWACAPLASAQERVLWIARDSAPELRDAVALELSARGFAILERPEEAPVPEPSEVRAACARAGAAAALWIDGSVHVVSREGAARLAALPGDPSPRAIAIIAASVVEEAILAEMAPPSAPAPRDWIAALGTPRESRATEEPPPASEAGIAAYFALRTSWLVLSHQGTLHAPAQTIEVGFSVDRTFRLGLSAVAPVAAPADATGTPGLGGGVSASLRGALGDVELRGGLELSALGRGDQNPLHATFPRTQPATLYLAGLRAGAWGGIGFRASSSFALLVGLGLHLVTYERAEPLGVGSVSITAEWF